MKAVRHVASLSRDIQERSRAIIKNILIMSNIAESDMAKVAKYIARHGQIALHFHPDRFDKRGLSVAQGLLNDGQYKSQFETHISNGMLSPVLGGQRDHWENSLFADAYHGVEGRPKYGALDVNFHPNGPAPRFGSCYLLTQPQVLQRCTFTYLDSYRNPPDKGTLDHFDSILSALMSESFERHYALGSVDLKPQKLVQQLLSRLPADNRVRMQQSMSTNLDHYIEAQVHGRLSLKHDINMLVADPCFENTAEGLALQASCEEYDIQLSWHHGLMMSVADVPDDFRGITMPSIAAKVADDGFFDARLIGLAVKHAKQYPPQWREFGTSAEVFQQLKLLWHVLVKFGVSRK